MTNPIVFLAMLLFFGLLASMPRRRYTEEELDEIERRYTEDIARREARRAQYSLRRLIHRSCEEGGKSDD